ncbi:MAG: bifunctional DNA primase/polymerase [Anaerolineae bacterium]|nr:bifunctional DNA primase/polymerase [Anaerolineae bacterium]
MGLNVAPQPHGKKGGYPWKRLQYGRLSRDNQQFGLDVLFAGQCNLAVMCGATSGNLFVIDCESLVALQHHMSQLHERQIPLWVVQTARGGHIYLRASNGEVHNVKSGIMSDAEIKGQRGYVLAPPSIHPTGATYTWLLREGKEIPVVHTRDINWLRDTSDQKIRLQTDNTTAQSTKGNWSYRVTSPCSNLSNATREYIESGHTITEGSRNNRLFKAACDMNGNGYSQSEAESVLTLVALGSGLPAFEIAHTIASAYSKSRNPSRPDIKPVSNNTFWHHALLWATNHKWQGRTLATDRALTLALVERCRLAANENGVFRASLRELAVLARLGVMTIRKALKRLKDADIIQKCGQDSTSGACLWRFTDKVIDMGKIVELNMNTVKVSPHWLRFSVSLFNSDTTERGALGHSVSFVYQFMNTLESPMMPSEIARSLGLTVNQVNYALRKMRNFGLLRRLKEGWLPVNMSVVQFEAHMKQVTDVAGKGARREAQFEREREIFAGRILHDKRLYFEKEAFYGAVMRDAQCRELLKDPLLVAGLELGGAIQLDDGWYLVGDSS